MHNAKPWEKENTIKISIVHSTHSSKYTGAR
jgi:hypothetical protein